MIGSVRRQGYHKVPAAVEHIAFTVTIYDYEVRRQNFGQVSNAFIRIVDESSGTELIRYDLGASPSPVRLSPICSTLPEACFRLP